MPEKKLTWVDLDSSPKNKIEEELIKKRVVQTEPGEKVKIPLPNSFQGWQNQMVDRETVTNKKNIAIGKPSKSTTNHTRELPAPAKSLSLLGVPLIPNKPAMDSDQPVWANPGMRPEDYVKGMKESDRTALNTSEYQFYNYFQRIRERLDHAWVPILRERLVVYYHSGRQLASDMDHTTKVLVILNGKGEIVRVQMLSESGTRDLDDAAVAAFNQAGPFPNPPSGMIDPHGEVHIPWDFVLKT